MAPRFVHLVLIALLVSPRVGNAQEGKPPKLPNIVWITSEDHGPHLGCYGDKLARTPTIDLLAGKGLRFRRAWSNAPVCAPSRTAIISGLYPTSTGAEHMRSLTRLPKEFRMFVVYLRELGYYCTNRDKEDYNLEKTGQVWDDSSKKAHWRNRRQGQPFFAVFNSTKSHESQLRNYQKPPATDPAKIKLPAYHPDIPEARIDWANYYDNLARVDADAAAVLAELDEAGLIEDTIVFYFSDHGSGMPRIKRTPLNAGLHVPFIVWFPQRWRQLAPEGYQPGGVSERLVSFVDLAPTILSLAGLDAPAWMQGHAFAGQFAVKGPAYLHGFRGRMDERYDVQRSVTDGRHVYLRNYLPHLPAGQHVDYMFLTRTTPAWKKLFDAGKLTEEQSLFWKAPRPPEELYDLEHDPDEVKNLAGSPEHQKILAKLRQACRKHILDVRDLGFLPEEEIHTRSQGATPYAMGHDGQRYPLERILEMAETVSSLDGLARLAPRAGLEDKDSAVRFWAAQGILMHGPNSFQRWRKNLEPTLQDPSPSVRVAAAEAFARFGARDEQALGLSKLLELAHPKNNSAYVSLAALNALDRLGDQVRPGLKEMQSWPTEVDKAAQRYAYGIPRLINKILGKR